MSEEKKKEKNVPKVRTRNRGRVGGMLDHLAEVFNAENEGWGCLWVYHPSHKPDLSNVIERMAEGYVQVNVEELGDTGIPGLNPDDPVRVGDLVLMKLPAAEMAAARAENRARAKEQRESIQKEYYGSMEREAKLRGPGGKIHRATPIGTVLIEERTLEVDREQRTSDSEE